MFTAQEAADTATLQIGPGSQQLNTDYHVAGGLRLRRGFHAVREPAAGRVYTNAHWVTGPSSLLPAFANSSSFLCLMNICCFEPMRICFCSLKEWVLVGGQADASHDKGVKSAQIQIQDAENRRWEAQGGFPGRQPLQLAGRENFRPAVGQSSSQITRCVQTGHRGGVHRSQNRERRIPTQKLHLRLVEKPRRRVSSRGFVQDGSTGGKTETGAPSRTPSKPGRWEEGRLHGEEAQSRRMFRKQNLQDSRRSKNPALSFGLRGRTCHLGNKRRTMSSIWML